MSTSSNPSSAPEATAPGVIGVFAECFNCTDAENSFVPGNNMVWGNSGCNNNQPSCTPDRAVPTNANFGKETGFGTPRTFQFGVRFDF